MPAYNIFSHFYSAAWSKDWADRAGEGIVRILEKHCDATTLRVLDVACGAGHMAGVLVSHGHNVVGIDGSTALLRDARRTAPRATFRTWRFGERIPHVGTFDAAICVYDSLNHARNEATALHVLKEMSRVVKPGGIILFDYNAARGFSRRWNFTLHVDRDWGWCEARLWYDKTRRRGIVSVHGMVHNGRSSRRFQETYEELPFRSRDVAAWLRAARLTPLTIPEPLKRLLPEEPGRVWVLARKGQAIANLQLPISD